MDIPGHDIPNQPIRPDHSVHESRPVGRRAPTKRRKSAEISGADKVDLSSRARDIRRAQKVAREAPDIRQERIAAAKQALEAGTLNLKGRDLAEKLLDDPLHKPQQDA